MSPKPQKTAKRVARSVRQSEPRQPVSRDGRRKLFVRSFVAVLIVAAVVLLALFWTSRPKSLDASAILALDSSGTDVRRLMIEYPINGAVFPPEIPPPTFRWEDPTQSDAWLVTCQFASDSEQLSFPCEERQWTPSVAQWKKIKESSSEQEANWKVLGVVRSSQDRVLSSATVSTSTSIDPVDAPIFYREVNLPFLEAVKDPTRIRWRFGSVGSPEWPRIVLEKLPVCGNCHSFSRDGSVLGMDVDYANDKGSYAIADVGEEVVLDGRNVISWSDFKRDDGQKTFGLLSQVSPDGRYVVGTVKDLSVFVGRDDMTFSQLFFPIKGILAVYDRQTETFRALPGADNPKYVQSNPTWSPDGRTIVFARSEAYELEALRTDEKVLLDESECREFLERGKPFRFDLCRIPFNGGDGGAAEPLEGASNNGMSNYFAEFSPNGRWIVFCRSKNYMLLQADSRLWIIPASGGEARELCCNTSRMNSWHSWSPNGRWIVFSSKMYSPYTQLFLTHMDEEGHSSPPVLLSHFTAPDRAANIPEFVNTSPEAIQVVRQQFLDDVSYVRAAEALREGSDFDGAAEACRQALKINPENVDAMCNLGIVALQKGMADEAATHLAEVIRRAPENASGHYNLGVTYTLQGKYHEAESEFQEVLRIAPDFSEAALCLGVLQFNDGRLSEAAETFALGVQEYANDPRLQFYLGLTRQRLGQSDEAVASYSRAIHEDADFVPALLGLASIRAADSRPELRDAEQAMSLARRACDLTHYRSLVALEVLAAACAENGQFDAALQAAAEAARCARTAGDPSAAERIARVTAVYSRKKPLREYDFAFDEFALTE